MVKDMHSLIRVLYDYKWAPGVGSVRKEMSWTLSRDGEWSATPSSSYFEFLIRFQKAGRENRVSEGKPFGSCQTFMKMASKRFFSA